ncbi:MAG: rhodanese-like domain-containing protein [Gemmatimonadaceae bacterium]
MLLRRFYDENLAQASYLIACEETREAIVIDPNADAAQYVRAAGADRVRITHVTETHIHADFVSGASALADIAGASLFLSGEGSGQWGYADDALRGAGALRDGSVIEIGQVRVRAMHTPGHTPEHLTFFVSDLARGPAPVGAVTGDFIFVGDVGRPDLLERTVGVAGSMEDSARALYRSLAKLKREPDHLQIWPGHGAGSACGKSLGAMPQSTLGYERLFNWALAEMSESEFVAKVLEDQPVAPRYFAVMKRVNRGTTERPKSATPKYAEFDELEAAIAKPILVIDTRPTRTFAAGHVPGTINIPLGKSFLNWTGALVPENADFYLIAETSSDDAIKVVLQDLCKIGVTRVRGIFRVGVLHEWESRRGPLQQVPQVDPPGLRELIGADGVQVIDVRNPDEWRRGHLPGAIHIPLAALPERLSEVDPAAPVILHCQGGSRSSIAASFLQAHQLDNVSNLAGGYEGWEKAGLEIERGR